MQLACLSENSTENSMDNTPDMDTLLRAVVYRDVDVEKLLDPTRPSWVRFDPDLGYVPADIVMRDGLDGCWNRYTHAPEGHRIQVHYADRPCRINTYGDSMTQCQQVSDGETWQEVLAAHLGEPIRNYGCGGHGVYQAIQRAHRVEETALGAEYILLNIFVDDHIRSLDKARWVRTAWFDNRRHGRQAYPLHGLPWSHLRYDLNQEQFVTVPGMCRTPEDLRRLTDYEYFREAFKDDQIVRLFLLELGGEAPCDDLQELARVFGLDVNLHDPERRVRDADRLHRVYGIRATEYLLEAFTGWIQARGKKMMILLTYCQGTMSTFLSGGERYDQEFVAYLRENSIPYVDGLLKHQEDFHRFKGDMIAYMGRYMVAAAGAAVFGHYNPTGNHQFAFWIKDTLVDWLTPKPPAYAPDGWQGMRGAQRHFTDNDS